VLLRSFAGVDTRGGIMGALNPYAICSTTKKGKK